MHLTRRHVHALREQEVGSGERDGVLLVDEVLRVRRRGRTYNRHHSVVSREGADGGKGVNRGVHGGGNRHASPRTRGRGGEGRHRELLERTSGLTGLRVDREHASDGEHVTNRKRGGTRVTVDCQRGRTLSADRAVNRQRGSSRTRTSRVLGNALAHVDFVVAQHARTHHARLELLADNVGRVEKTLQAFHQASVTGRVDRRVTHILRDRRFVKLLVTREQDRRGTRRGARRTDRLVDALVGVGNVSVHRGGQLADTRLQHAVSEVVQLHGQFSRREVHANVLLVGHGERGELLVVVLHLKGSTVGHQSAVRQTDTQGGTNLGTFHGKRVVVGAVDVAGKHKVVLEDFESLAGNHINRKQAISHGISPKKKRLVAAGFQLLDLSLPFSLNPLRRSHGLYRPWVGGVVGCGVSTTGSDRSNRRGSGGCLLHRRVGQQFCLQPTNFLSLQERRQVSNLGCFRGVGTEVVGYVRANFRRPDCVCHHLRDSDVVTVCDLLEVSISFGRHFLTFVIGRKDFGVLPLHISLLDKFLRLLVRQRFRVGIRRLKLLHRRDFNGSLRHGLSLTHCLFPFPLTLLSRKPLANRGVQLFLSERLVWLLSFRRLNCGFRRCRSNLFRRGGDFRYNLNFFRHFVIP